MFNLWYIGLSVGLTTGLIIFICWILKRAIKRGGANE